MCSAYALHLFICTLYKICTVVHTASLTFASSVCIRSRVLAQPWERSNFTLHKFPLEWYLLIQVIFFHGTIWVVHLPPVFLALFRELKPLTFWRIGLTSQVGDSAVCTIYALPALCLRMWSLLDVRTVLWSALKPVYQKVFFERSIKTFSFKLWKWLAVHYKNTLVNRASEILDELLAIKILPDETTTVYLTCADRYIAQLDSASKQV